MSMASYPFLVWGAFLIDEEVAKYMAKSCEVDVDPDDFETVMELFEDDVGRVGAFDGDAESSLHSKVNEVRYVEYSDDVVYYLPPRKEFSLFEVAYNSPEELLAEHQETMRNMGVDLPDDFDWWGHIVDIVGTYFC